MASRGGDNLEKFIYMDYAATTPARREVVEAMMPYFTQEFGNPSSLYTLGRSARGVIEDARDRVAAFIGADPREIVFTGGGTEADNFAIKGIAYGNEKKGNHIITTTVEHHALLEPCHFLEKRGFEVTYVPVDEHGMVDPADIAKAMKDTTVLVSVMHANNEVGTIEPLAEIGKIARERGIQLHTDAVQSVGHIPVDVNELNVDLLSMSAHKLYGPKGVGALYVRRGTRMVPFMHGGSQEHNRRAGTHNVPGIVGFAKAIELAEKEMAAETVRLTELRDYLIRGMLGQVSYARLNGHPTKRLPSNASFCLVGAEGEAILLSLDMEGISCSSGSACTSGTLDPSHVLIAMGVPAEIAHSSLRLSLGRETTKEDIDYVLEVLPPIIERLRAMSPLDASWGKTC
jgi:cysteine desulfurase